MSVAAQKWAWSQNIPQRPKFVLVTLADQTDEKTGRVCYQKCDVGFFVEKCCIPERSFYRCIAALGRQGYLRRESAPGRNKEPTYWLCLDREPSELAEWTWAADYEISDSDDEQDIDSGSALMAEQNQLADCQNDGGAPPLRAEHKDSIDKPKNQKPPMEKPKIGFSKSAQALDRKAVQASVTDIGELPGMIFVIEGTRWWDLYAAYRRSIGRPINFADRGIGKYRGKTGRYVKTDLWEQILKPHSTAGPSATTMTADDEKYLAETGLR